MQSAHFQPARSSASVRVTFPGLPFTPENDTPVIDFDRCRGCLLSMGKSEIKSVCAATGVGLLTLALVLFCLPVSSRADEAAQAVSVEQGLTAGNAAAADTESGPSTESTMPGRTSDSDTAAQGPSEASGDSADSATGGNSSSSEAGTD